MVQLALERDEFNVNYQPQIETANGLYGNLKFIIVSMSCKGTHADNSPIETAASNRLIKLYQHLVEHEDWIAAQELAVLLNRSVNTVRKDLIELTSFLFQGIG